MPGWYWGIQEMLGQRWQIPSRTLGNPWRHLVEEDLNLSMFNLIHGNFLNSLGLGARDPSCVYSWAKIRLTGIITCNMTPSICIGC